MPANVVEILGYGVIGLGFLLAFLAYRLLGKEQNKDKPRPALIRAIYVFMAFSVVLSLIGFASEFFEKENTSIEKAIDSFAFLKGVEKEVAKLAHDAEPLIDNPNNAQQDRINSEIHRIMGLVGKENRKGKVYNDLLEEIQDALAQEEKNPKQVNLAIVNFYKNLQFMIDNFENKLAQIKPGEEPLSLVGIWTLIAFNDKKSNLTFNAGEATAIGGAKVTGTMVFHEDSFTFTLVTSTPEAKVETTTGTYFTDGSTLTTVEAGGPTTKYQFTSSVSGNRLTIENENVEMVFEK